MHKVALLQASLIYRYNNSLQFINNDKYFVFFFSKHFLICSIYSIIRI